MVFDVTDVTTINPISTHLGVPQQTPVLPQRIRWPKMSFSNQSLWSWELMTRTKSHPSPQQSSQCSKNNKNSRFCPGPQESARTHKIVMKSPVLQAVLSETSPPHYLSYHTSRNFQGLALHYHIPHMGWWVSKLMSRAKELCHTIKTPLWGTHRNITNGTFKRFQEHFHCSKNEACFACFINNNLFYLKMRHLSH